MKYKGGLTTEILTSVAPSKVRNYATLVNKCHVAEDCSKILASKRSETYKRKQALHRMQPQ